MSRIASYRLYKCPVCSQILLRPVWGTIGPRIPNDLGVANDVFKTCTSCGAKKQICDYQLVGATDGSDDYAKIRWFSPSDDPDTKTTKLSKLARLFKKKQRTLDDYPSFQD